MSGGGVGWGVGRAYNRINTVTPVVVSRNCWMNGKQCRS